MSAPENFRLVICTKGSLVKMARLSNGATLLVNGKQQIAKQILQDIDLEKKQFAYKMVEGDLMELYKNMIITMHVETKGGVDFITWTIEYELLSADNSHPLSPLNFLIEFTKDVETHIFG
ncbi:hypothetical protein ACJIZ3_019849 [Penstemon smallii]|uniref:Bet v I/Major latex protein domain-containing protein n=1 Tax=Penstemon smallii TaxID=265156 RepID=A0ABD3T296_9LAMI